MSSNTSSSDLMVNRTMSSMTSEDSIVISDEELNYSSLHSKRGNCDVPDGPQKTICGKSCFLFLFGQSMNDTIFLHFETLRDAQIISFLVMGDMRKYTYSDIGTAIFTSM